jgi:hypothetical protein
MTGSPGRAGLAGHRPVRRQWSRVVPPTRPVGHPSTGGGGLWPWVSRLSHGISPTHGGERREPPGCCSQRARIEP